MKLRYLFLFISFSFFFSYQAQAAGKCFGLPACLAQLYALQNSMRATAPDGRPRLTRADLEKATEMSRPGRTVVIGKDQNCKTYASGCKDCQPPEHAKILSVKSVDSRSNLRVRIQKDGQNHLHESTQQVLLKIALETGRNVEVTSGFRSCAYQKLTSQGVSRSMHLMGRAADFYVRGMPLDSEALSKLGRRTLNKLHLTGGTGIYRSGTSHVDTRSYNVQWDWRR